VRREHRKKEKPKGCKNRNPSWFPLQGRGRSAGKRRIGEERDWSGRGKKIRKGGR